MERYRFEMGCRQLHHFHHLGLRHPVGGIAGNPAGKPPCWLLRDARISLPERGPASWGGFCCCGGGGKGTGGGRDKLGGWLGVPPTPPASVRPLTNRSQAKSPSRVSPPLAGCGRRNPALVAGRCFACGRGDRDKSRVGIVCPCALPWLASDSTQQAHPAPRSDGMVPADTAVGEL